MKRVLALAVILSLPGTLATAGDVRPPSNADSSGTPGQITLPGTSQIEAPPIKTTMQEKRKVKAGKAVEKSKIQELRNLAIEEFGQSSSSGASSSGASSSGASSSGASNSGDTGDGG